jgi:hypothetical protein
VAELAEGSRLLSGYRANTSILGSNPSLSARKITIKLRFPEALYCKFQNVIINLPLV